MARGWLAKGRQPVVAPKVERYADEMRAGRWDPDLHFQTPIIVSPGKLSNGFHRLNAVVSFGGPVLMWVRGDPDADRVSR